MPAVSIQRALALGLTVVLLLSGLLSASHASPTADLVPRTSTSSSSKGHSPPAPTQRGSSSKGKSPAHEHVSTELTLGRPSTHAQSGGQTHSQGQGRLGHLIQGLKSKDQGVPKKVQGSGSRVGRPIGSGRPVGSSTKVKAAGPKNKVESWWKRPGGKPRAPAGQSRYYESGVRWRQKQKEAKQSGAKPSGAKDDHPAKHPPGGGHGPGSPTGGGHGQAVGR